MPVPVTPMQPIPVDSRSVGLTAFDSNYVTPYVQNLTMAVTRNVGRKVTVDVRYVGTLSRKLYGTIDVNSSNFLYNGLKEAFDSARSAANPRCWIRCSTGSRSRRQDALRSTARR